MLKQGGLRPGSLTKFLPPLSAGNRAALVIWQRLGGELRRPDLDCELVDVDDEELMLARLRAIRDIPRHG